MTNLISRIENYLLDYVTLTDPAYALPLALWILGTYCYAEFDAYAYVVITSATKRSGKTRLGELISFTSHDPVQTAAITAAGIFRVVEARKPTLINDESEDQSSEAAGAMRSVLNVGYKKGAKTIRIGAKGVIEEFDTYCPKVFILIGDVFDTLRDRSIVFTMRRAETRKDFRRGVAESQGAEIRKACEDAVKENRDRIAEKWASRKGLPFLGDRDEEIWGSLFVLCSVFCPTRLHELSRIAIDLATEKTAEARSYLKLKEGEDAHTEDEYRKRLLLDLYGVFMTLGVKTISSTDAIDQLRSLPTAPWRKFKGTGLTYSMMGDMLRQFHCGPGSVQIGQGRKGRKVCQGYKAAAVAAAVSLI